MSKKWIMISCIIIFCFAFFVLWSIKSSEKQLFVGIFFDNFVIDEKGNQELLSQWDSFIANSEVWISGIEIDIQTNTGFYLYGGGQVFEDDTHPNTLTEAIQRYWNEPAQWFMDSDIIINTYTKENKKRVLNGLGLIMNNKAYEDVQSLVLASTGTIRYTKHRVPFKNDRKKDSFDTSNTFFSNELCINDQAELKVRATTNADWKNDSLTVLYDENRMVSQMRYDLRLFERDVSLVELFCESIDQESETKKEVPIQWIGYANLSQYLFLNQNEKDKHLPLIRRLLFAIKNNDLADLQKESAFFEEDIFSFLPFPHLQDIRQWLYYENKIIGKASMSSMSDNYLVDYRISVSGEYLILDLANPQVQIFDGNTYVFYTWYISLEWENVFYSNNE